MMTLIVKEKDSTCMQETKQRRNKLAKSRNVVTDTVVSSRLCVVGDMIPARSYHTVGVGRHQHWRIAGHTRRACLRQHYQDSSMVVADTWIVADDVAVRCQKLVAEPQQNRNPSLAVEHAKQV